MGAEWVGSFGVVAAALITGVFGVVLRIRKETNAGHLQSAYLLEKLEDKVKQISSDLVGLTVWTKVHEERHRLMEEREKNGS